MAQLDRASDYGSEGCGFDSCWARQIVEGFQVFSLRTLSLVRDRVIYKIVSVNNTSVSKGGKTILWYGTWIMNFKIQMNQVLSRIHVYLNISK